ncbi:hypothetical protein K505DRAFT_76333 [Melanomma pulvis-pyrius CBS 109.77]|uniref:Uncharacterized protein n=1 Tax=Melanomma pulvis-pyrius CBS 109.77 TaxID=1314802 RepID=A0A6A6X313_9PLEO|nr:hypothetical protein K505DRAFT_76333 [Melanomma pulvis-pyrius CBS 109.77]
MRSPTSSQPPIPSNPSLTITNTTALAISIKTLDPKSKNKDKTRTQLGYRAIQRPDGVVVEYPRYQPSTSPSPRPSPTLSTKTFEPKPLALTSPTKPISRTLQIQQLRDANLRGIRDFNAELARQRGRDGYNGPVECGRGGYNTPVERGRGEYYEPVEECQLTPMERFLRNQEPWTPYSPRMASEGMRVKRVIYE